MVLRSFKDVCLFSAGCADNFSFYKKKNNFFKKKKQAKHREHFKVSYWKSRKILMCDVVIENSLDPSVHTPLQHTASSSEKSITHSVCLSVNTSYKIF